IRSYPQEAIREALLNSVVHREYSFSSSTLISIFDEKIEFVSIGGLVKGICIDDIKLGISVLRNKNLADIFYRLHLIEAYGTGIPKIMECYQNSSAKPEIEISDNAFKLTLPKFSQTDNTSNLNDNRENDIIELLADNGDMTRTEIQSALSLSQSTVLRELNNMLSKQIIRKVGSGRNTKYSLVNK
ncbi:MAG: ATP-binding protein, partial [Acutalibacteraceae bacterium]